MNKILKNITEKYREKNGNIIFLLQETQEALGYIPKQAIDFFSEELRIASSRIYGVATFYSQFRLKPTGKNMIVACCGTACHVKGSESIIRGLRRELGISDGEDTSPDSEFTIEEIACVGACSIAPVVIINKKVSGKATVEKLKKELQTIKPKKSE